MKKVSIIGAGLAGSEAAWYLANNNINVKLYEKRGKFSSPAHHSDKFAELVCSNSLKNMSLENAAGLLKWEMKRFNSIIMEAAENHQVPAGGALAVDRELFSEYITNRIKEHPLIEVINDECNEVSSDEITIIACGPLPSEGFINVITSIIGDNYLSFYDAAAPIIDAQTIDMNVAYKKSRYDKGTADYINCPMTLDEFKKFQDFIVNAETAPLKDFEKDSKVFEGCMPVEVMAKRGEKTLTFGPLKPKGLSKSMDERPPYAVVQLRQDNVRGTLYNMVGFQTNLKWGQQDEMLKLIPGLENAEIVRYGVMHKNTFINAPKLLNESLQLKHNDNIFFAGQITGVEGYIESAASGILVAINVKRKLDSEELVAFPKYSSLGSIIHYITHASQKHFQPMNANFGIFEPLEVRIKNKQDRYEEYRNRAMNSVEKFRTENKL